MCVHICTETVSKTLIYMYLHILVKNMNSIPFILRKYTCVIFVSSYDETLSCDDRICVSQ